MWPNGGRASDTSTHNESGGTPHIGRSRLPSGEAFPAKTAGAELQELASRIVDGAREFELTCDKIRWEVTPGVVVEALSYKGRAPGPIIGVTEGERMRISVTNKTDQTTGVDGHGQRIVNKMDRAKTRRPILSTTMTSCSSSTTSSEVEVFARDGYPLPPPFNATL